MVSLHIPRRLGTTGARLLIVRSGVWIWSLLDDGSRTEVPLMSGMTLVEMIGEDF